MAKTSSIRLAGMFGPWGIALQGIQKSLAMNGIESDFLSGQDVFSSMLQLEKDEKNLDVGNSSRFDEAGLQLLDSGVADVGVNFREQAEWAYRGLFHQESQPHTNLRAIARLIQPQYVGFAATYESGITSLEQVAREQRPIRLLTISRSKSQTRFMGYVHTRVLEESGFSQADVIEWGGRVFTAEDGIRAILEENVDVIGLSCYGNCGAIWGYMWMHAQIRLNLRFLPIAETVRDALAQELGIQKGPMPAQMLRGVDTDVPTFAMRDHTVTSSNALSDEHAFPIARAMDEHPSCLQEGAVAFSYNPRTGTNGLSMPMHPGAEAYYRTQGYLD